MPKRPARLKDTDAAHRRRLRRRLLAWYDRAGRTLPWRAPAGDTADPYRVWLSEIMLQQTTVVTVTPYFEAFLARWPTVEALARAELDDVLHAWQGLGYYARARNLHAAAKMVANEMGGHFPENESALRTLPGVGTYTAAAIAAIAFGRETVAVDGNVIRVLARLDAVETPLPSALGEIAGLASGLAPGTRPGDFVQALMDLGATVCTPKSPDCPQCPWRGDCAGYRDGLAEILPRRAPAKAKPVRHGVAFWARRRDGAVLLRRRPEKGLLGGMMEVPSTDWRTDAWSDEEAKAEAPLKTRWRALPGLVRHTFTHFHLELTVFATQGLKDGDKPNGTQWCPPDRLDGQALPTLMKKVVSHALGKGKT